MILILEVRDLEYQRVALVRGRRGFAEAIPPRTLPRTHTSIVPLPKVRLPKHPKTVGISTHLRPVVVRMAGRLPMLDDQSPTLNYAISLLAQSVVQLKH